MTAMISEQQVHTPQSLAEALLFLAGRRDEGWRPLAGGTDLMVGLYRDRTGGDRWLNLSRLNSELGGIRRDADVIRIGASTTMTQLRRSALLQDVCPLIGQAAASVGAVQIQNRATVGGNIANSSPAGDTLPVWLALDAEIELQSASSIRRMAYADFLQGYRRTALQPDELLTAVLFQPRLDHELRWYFRKVATRRAQGISKLVFTGLTDVVDGHLQHVRLAFGCTGPATLRAHTAEQAADGRVMTIETGIHAAEKLSDDLSPIDDHRSTADYRSRVARNLVREFLAGNLKEVSA
ncbi:MAG: FAD binding domain-containing protein [Planctomycetota bacterium]|jgi:CO/xanthine dehydrogenase FAD-binding subunit